MELPSKTNSSGQRKIMHGEVELEYHIVFSQLVKSEYYYTNNHYESTGFIPYSPLNPVKTNKLNLFTGFKWDVDEKMKEMPSLI